MFKKLIIFIILFSASINGYALSEIKHKDTLTKYTSQYDFDKKNIDGNNYNTKNILDFYNDKNIYDNIKISSSTAVYSGHTDLTSPKNRVNILSHASSSQSNRLYLNERQEQFYQGGTKNLNSYSSELEVRIPFFEIEYDK